MYEILRVLFCLLVIGVAIIICYLIDLIQWKHKIERYNKRYNDNLDTSFKNIYRLRVQFDEWCVSMFVPSVDTKLSLWERIYGQFGEKNEK